MKPIYSVFVFAALLWVTGSACSSEPTCEKAADHFIGLFRLQIKELRSDPKFAKSDELQKYFQKVANLAPIMAKQRDKWVASCRSQENAIDLSCMAKSKDMIEFGACPGFNWFCSECKKATPDMGQAGLAP